MTGLLAHRAGWFLSAITVLVCLAVLAADAPRESWAHGSLVPIGLVLLVLAWEASSVSRASSDRSPRESIGVRHSTLRMTQDSGWSTVIWSAFPALMMMSIALAGSSALPLLAGALVLVSAVIAFQSRIMESRIATLTAVRIVAVVLVAVRMIPFDLETLRPPFAGTVLGIVGGAFLVASFSIGRTVLPSQAVFAFLLAAFAPDQPLSAALFPFMAASMVLLNRRRDLAMLSIAVVLAILCGRWSYPLVVLPVLAFNAARLLARRSGGVGGDRWPAVGAPAFPGAWLGHSTAAHLVRVLPLFPNAFASVRGDLPLLLSVLGLVLLSGVVRPSVAMMYVLMAAGASLSFAKPHSEKLAFPAVVIAGIVVLFLGWSGAFGSLAFFPLPLPWVPLLAAIAICLLPVLFGNQSFAAIAAVALCVIGARFGQQVSSDEVHIVARSLRAGESMAVDTGTARTRVAVVVWALNGAGLNPEARLGTLEFLDDSGKGFRQTFQIGDAPDWGSFRRSITFYSKNSWPSRPVGIISGRGPAAFVSGAGIIEGKLPGGRRISLIRMTADPGLAPGTSLQIQEVHFATDPAVPGNPRIGS